VFISTIERKYKMSKFSLPDLWKKETDNAPLFSSLQHEIERVFDEFGSLSSRFENGFLHPRLATFSPKFDLSETDESIDIEAELPGMTLEQIDISAKDKSLIISGEKSTEKDEVDKDYHITERSYGKFYRSIPLGFTIDPEVVKAKYKDGVLKVTVAKPAEIDDGTQKIEISAG